MECPCTTRTKKIITGVETKDKDTCGANATIADAMECFEAASQLVGSVTKNITSSARPRRQVQQCNHHAGRPLVCGSESDWTRLPWLTPPTPLL